MICINTSKLLIITWVAMALLIGIGVGYLLGVNGVGQRAQQNFGPGPQGQAPQPLNQGEAPYQKSVQGEAPPGAPGGRNPVPNQNGSGPMPNSGTQGQPINPNQP